LVACSAGETDACLVVYSVACWAASMDVHWVVQKVEMKDVCLVAQSDATRAVPMAAY